MSTFDDWFAEKDFTTDWTSSRFPVWQNLFESQRSRISRILEIGSWEGRSAIFFLNFFPNSRVSCIDPFSSASTADVAPHWREAWTQSEGRFDANLAPFGERCRKLKGTSYERLGQLAIRLETFDLIYVDGSHAALDVYADAAMSWPLLAADGFLIFDDYQWIDAPQEEGRPRAGIDAFLAATRDDHVEVHRGAQIILRKQGRSYPASDADG